MANKEIYGLIKNGVGVKITNQKGREEDATQRSLANVKITLYQPLFII